MAISWMLVSGIFGAISNLCIRQNIDEKGSSKAFFTFYLFFTCFVTILLHPVRTSSYGWNMQVIFIGFLAGISLGAMKLMLGKALKKGPSSLTFAAVNSASVMPVIVIVLISGKIIDYKLSYADFLGSILVIIGLFWAGW